MNKKKEHLYIHGCNGDVRLNERRLKYLILTRPYIVQHHQLLSQSLYRRKKTAEKQNKAKQSKNKLKQRKKIPFACYLMQTSRNHLFRRIEEQCKCIISER